MMLAHLKYSVSSTLLLSIALVGSNANANSGALDPNPAAYSTRLRNAAFVLSEKGIDLPIQYRINVPHTGVSQASSEIVYRWEKEYDDAYTQQPPAVITDLGDAPVGQTPNSVRGVLLLGPNNARRYACPSSKREGDPQFFARATHSDQPDIAARAILGKNAAGKDEVIIFAGHTTVYAIRGKNFQTISRDCENPLYVSADRRDPLSRRNTEWLSTVYTRDGKKIYGYVNNDWRAYNLPENEKAHLALYDKKKLEDKSLRLSDENRWWWASLTSLVLNDNSKRPYETFRSPSSQPSDYVIASPAMVGETSEVKKFDPTDSSFDWFNGNGRFGATGFIHTTNIMKSPVDRHYYMLMKRFRNVPRDTVLADADKEVGFCLFRAEPSAPLELSSAWRGYTSQNGFTPNLRRGECDFIFQPNTKFKIQNGTQDEYLTVDSIRHLSYNAHLRKFMILAKGKRKVKGSDDYTWVLALLTSSSADLRDWKTDGAHVVMVTDLLLPNRATQKSAQGETALEVNSEVQYFSIIDHDYRDLVETMRKDGRIPASEVEERRNFDITGSQPWVYISFKRSVKQNGSWENKALDVVRFPIAIDKK